MSPVGITQSVVAVLCVAIFAGTKRSARGVADAQIAPQVVGALAVGVLALDGLVWLLRHVNWGGLFK